MQAIAVAGVVHGIVRQIDLECRDIELLTTALTRTYEPPSVTPRIALNVVSP